MSLEEAILNGWWQGIALTALVWLVMKGQTRVSAATRLAIWQVTMAMVVLLPAVVFLSTLLMQPTVVKPVPVLAVQKPEGIVEPIAPQALPAEPVPGMPALFTFYDEEPLMLLAAAGGVMAGLQLLRLAIGYWVVRRIKRSGTESGVALPRMMLRNARILLSSRVGMPMAIGYRNPAIVLPERMVRALSANEIEQVVLHEAAHLERHDDWYGLIERLVRAIFCIQPAVWWIGREIERERELACDDWVVHRNGESKTYASALARVAELGSIGQVPLLATGAGRRKEIFTRMEALLDQTRNRVTTISSPMVLAAALLITFVVSQSAPFSKVFGFSLYNSRSVISDGNTRREFSLKGDIDFTEDEQDVATMTPGSRLLISREEGWMRRRVEIEGDENGQMVRHYFVGGVAQPYGAEAKRFVARELPGWLKQQGRNLNRRLERWIQSGGVEEALREIEEVPNTGIKREYLSELFRRTTLDHLQLRRWLRIVEKLESDDDRTQLLELSESRTREAQLLPVVLDVIQKMHADDHRSELMSRMLDDLQEADLPRWLRALAAIHNEEHRRDLLKKLASDTKRELPAHFFEAIRNLHSQDGLREVIETALQHHGQEVITQQEAVRQAARMHSEEMKRDLALLVLEQSQNVSESTVLELRKLAGQLHSEQARAELLDKISLR